MTTPTPAAIPRAGLSLTESLRRQEAAHDAADALLHAPPGALEQAAAEQGIGPVADPDELAAPEGERLTDDEHKAFHRAIHEPGPAPTPAPPFAWVPGVARQPNPMARDQYVRRAGLELAVKFYSDDPGERSDADVLATAKVWAEWIRTGQATTTGDTP